MPSPYVLGARKVGRPFCEDRAYAEYLGVSVRLIRRHGGAKYLKTLPESSLNLILWPTAVKIVGRSLVARGMTAQPPVPKLFKPAQKSWPVDRMAAANHIFERLTCKTSRLG